MNFAEDLATMMRTDEFATHATIVLPADLAGGTVTGIFDAAYLLIDVGADVQSSAPAFILPTDSVPADVVSALDSGAPVSVEIDGCAYQVVELKPDGTGVSVLRLRK